MKALSVRSPEGGLLVIEKSPDAAVQLLKVMVTYRYARRLSPLAHFCLWPILFDFCNNIGP
jgi:hypothetical protein